MNKKKKSYLKRVCRGFFFFLRNVIWKEPKTLNRKKKITLVIEINIYKILVSNYARQFITKTMHFSAIITVIDRHFGGGGGSCSQTGALFSDV